MRTVELLWTSGWDSTYRLLDAALQHRRPVRPHYVIDRTRRSMANELEALEVLRATIGELHPAIELHPLVVVERDDLPPMPEVTAAFGRLRKLHRLGGQYEWLARYARSASVEGLELSVERDGHVHGVVRAHVEPHDVGGDAYHRVVAPPGSDVDLVFGAFHFPFFDLTKAERRCEAHARGYDVVLARTWFCHRPTRAGLPCGICRPCTLTLRAGFSERLPPCAHARHTRAWLHRALRSFGDLFERPVSRARREPTSSR